MNNPASDLRPFLTFEGATYRVPTKAAAYRLPDGRIVTVKGWFETLPEQGEGVLLAVEDASID